MKVGIFGGSFDPVHNEHVSIAKNAIDALGLDKLFIVPAYIAPHKLDKRLTEGSLRIKMLKAAFSKIDKAEVSDYELLSGGTSYSYLTCEHFASLYPNAERFFIMGEDMLENFPTWKNPERIVSLFNIAVCRRASDKNDLSENRAGFYNRFGKNFIEIPYNGAAVSSTDIRVKARLGLDISELVPKKVNKIIRDDGVYLIPFADKALSLEKEKRAAHSLRVALTAGNAAKRFHIDEYSATLAGLMHDVAKNLKDGSPYLEGFVRPEGVPAPILHQFTGAYVTEHTFGVTDEDVLNAIRYHTTGRENMSPLEKLIYLSDMVEPGRNYPGLDEIRAAFMRDLDECMYLALKLTIGYLNGEDIYPLTLSAYKYYSELQGEK